MPSSLPPTLAKLDDCVQMIQSQLNCLGAALEFDDAQLRRAATEGCQHAAILRTRIKAIRPEASWADRQSLESLIQDLQAAAEAERNQQRRTKLVTLAKELEAGKINHRSSTRAAALNSIRLAAVRELQIEAAQAGRAKELPGPSASEWLHWACSLQETMDAAVLAELRKDFPGLERLTCEMEASYWEAPAPAMPSVDAIRAGAAEPFVVPTRRPFTDAVDQNHFDTSGSAESPLKSEPTDYETEFRLRHSGSGTESRMSPPVIKSGAEMERPTQAVHVVPVEDTLIATILAAPHVKICEHCGCTFPLEFSVCPFDNHSLSPIAEGIRIVGGEKSAAFPVSQDFKNRVRQRQRIAARK